MPDTGARMIVRSRLTRACASRARAASTSGLPSTEAPEINAWFEVALAGRGSLRGRRLRLRRPRRGQSGLGLLEGGPGRAQLLAGDRAGFGQRRPAAVVETRALVARCGRLDVGGGTARLGAAHADLCSELAVRGHVAGDPPARLVVSGLGLGERQARVGLVENDQGLAGRDALRVADQHPRDMAGDERRHLGDVGADIGVVGGDVPGVQGLVAPIAAAGEHEAGREADEQLLALGLPLAVGLVGLLRQRLAAVDVEILFDQFGSLGHDDSSLYE